MASASRASTKRIVADASAASLASCNFSWTLPYTLHQRPFHSPYHPPRPVDHHERRGQPPLDQLERRCDLRLNRRRERIGVAQRVVDLISQIAELGDGECA